MTRRHHGEERQVVAFTTKGLLGGRRGMQKRPRSQYQHDVLCVEHDLRRSVLMAWHLSSATQHLSKSGKPGNTLILREPQFLL